MTSQHNLSVTTRQKWQLGVNALKAWQRYATIV